jgi:branched-chain amino acid transport system substrate-binding protein
MSSLSPNTFASLLRHHRQALGLTQEELAERARLSVQAIGALERGTRQAPRRETVDLLAEALALTGPERAAFETAARGQRGTNPPISPLPATPPEATPRSEANGQPTPGPLSPGEAFPSARLSPLRKRGRLLAGLVGGLLLAGLLLSTALLPGIHTFLKGGTLCLATDFTTSGSYVFTTPLQRAVNLAVMQNQHLDHGYQLQVRNYHDPAPQEGDSGPSTGARNVQEIAQNPCMVGIIGPLFSSIAAAQMPVAANAGLVMISPGNTVSGLTLQPYAALDGYDFEQLHPPGKPLTYFRIAPTNVAEGGADAAFAFQTLEARSAYVVSDRTAYGAELVSGFTQGFQVKGGTIAGTTSIPADNTSAITDLAARIATINPDAVFFGGTTKSAAEMLKVQLQQHRYTGPFICGDAIALEPDFITQVGTQAANDIFASDAAYNLGYSTSEAAAQFIRAYTAHYPGNEYLSSFTAEAYDAAMVLITAIKQLIQADQTVTRATVLEQVRHIQYTGVIGPISFDENGDITHGVLTMYIVRTGQWVYLQQMNT